MQSIQATLSWYLKLAYYQFQVLNSPVRNTAGVVHAEQGKQSCVKCRRSVGSGSAFPPFQHSGPNYQASVDWWSSTAIPNSNNEHETV